MSEEQTKNLPNDYLKLILAQFAAVNSRLDSMDERLGRLEANTKPIWENALKEIAETRAEMREGFESVRAELRAEMDKLRGEFRAEAGTLRGEFDLGLRKVAKQIDVLNH